MNLVDRIEKEQLKAKLPRFEVGDVVDVQLRIPEADKERIQVFNGTVIARKGTGLRETFTVRRIVQGEGVERVFPIHSPFVASVHVTRKGKVRRAKLYYLRKRVGKSTKVREDITATAAPSSDEPASRPEPALTGTPTGRG
jgi:large subunit ribosomal protein L19